jgi:hypothetical protein
MIRPLGIIRNLKIHIHGIPYITTFIFLKDSVVDSSYYMLLGNLGLKMQRLHMTKVTMSLLFKVMEQSEQYQLTRTWEQKLDNLKYLFVMTC